MGIDLTGSAASPGDARRVRRLWLLPPLLLAAAVAASALAYPYLPGEMPTHWGFDGRPTNLMPRRFAAAALPAMMVWIGFITAVVVWSASQTREGRDLPAWLSPAVTSATMGLMLLLHIALLGSGLGWGISMPLVANLGVGALFLGLGWATPRVPPNPFFGIRTARTLACPDAWHRANRVGGRWLMAAGAATMAAAPLPGAWPLAVMTGAVVTACVAAVVAARAGPGGGTAAAGPTVDER
jgi:uncharacterized membrane protein